MAAPTEPEIENQDSGGEEEELHGQMSFFDHLEELRARLINIVIVVAVAFLASWYSKDGLFAIIREPIHDIKDRAGNPLRIVVTSPTDAFNLALKVCFVAALFIAAPFIIREIWGFVGPALYKRERRYALPFIVSASVLFIMGGAFGYFIAFPLAMKFLIEFGWSLDLDQVQSAREYFDLFLIFELLLGIVFEIPAVIFMLSRLGLVSGPFLLRNIQYALLLTVIVAAIATPTTDIPNLLMIAVPMMGLYCVGIVVAYIFGKKKKE